MRRDTKIWSSLVRLATVIAIILCAVGCFKKVTTNTTAVVKTLLQETSGGTTTPATDVDVYAFYTENEEWTIASYADALNHTITSTTDGEQRTEPDVIGEPYGEYEGGNFTALPLTSSPAMIVVVERQTKMYAYMFKQLLAENLPQTYLTLIFHPWRDKAYTEGTKVGSIWNIFPPESSDEESGENDEENGGENSGGGGENSGGENGETE